MDATRRAGLINDARPTGTEARLWVTGEWRNTPVIRVPVAALTFNIDNRRFVAERQLFEQQLGRSLDPENSDVDSRSVEAILLDTNHRTIGDRVEGTPGKDYRALRQDWQRRNQESPFWIRADGTVENGNRRLAMLRRLQRDEGSEGYEYVEAVVLDRLEVNELAIFEMEQREQLTEDYKVRYTDINLLLAIRDAANQKGIDWLDSESIDEVASALQHVMSNNKGYAVIQLHAIKYMDAYLEDVGLPGRYDKLIRQIERFRDVGTTMRHLQRDDPERAPAMLDVLFAAVNAGLNHQDVRDIRALFKRDPDEFNRLAQDVRDAEGEWEPPTNGEALGDPEVFDEEIDDSDDPEEAREPPGPVVKDYPKAQVARVFEEAFDRHRTAQTEDILKVVVEINTRLASLISSHDDRLSPALAADTGSDLREAVSAMSAWFEEHGSLFRGRSAGCPAPPAQIRTCALTHPAPALSVDGKSLRRPRVEDGHGGPVLPAQGVQTFPWVACPLRPSADSPHPEPPQGPHELRQRRAACGPPRNSQAIRGAPEQATLLSPPGRHACAYATRP